MEEVIVRKIAEAANNVKASVERVIVGKGAVVELAIIALLCIPSSRNCVNIMPPVFQVIYRFYRGEGNKGIKAVCILRGG